MEVRACLSVPQQRPTRGDRPRLRVHPERGGVGSFKPMVAGLVSSYDAVEELYAQPAPEAPDGRTWKRPGPAENPLGAWYVQTEIQERADGPLAGRRVAIKQHRGRRGADENGLVTLEGFVASPDATVVTRPAGRRGHDHRQGRAARPVLFRRQPPLGGGAGAQPLGTTRPPAGPRAAAPPWSPRERPTWRWAGTRGADPGSRVRGAARFGHKPTDGLVPYTGAFPIKSTHPPSRPDHPHRG